MFFIALIFGFIFGLLLYNIYFYYYLPLYKYKNLDIDKIIEDNTTINDKVYSINVGKLPPYIAYVIVERVKNRIKERINE